MNSRRVGSLDSSLKPFLQQDVPATHCIGTAIFLERFGSWASSQTEAVANPAFAGRLSVMAYELVPCQHCGEDIPADANFCRHCGSSDQDGWKDDAYDGVVDDEFDYDEFVEENFPHQYAADGGPRGYTNKNTKPVWRLVAVLLLILFALGYAIS